MTFCVRHFPSSGHWSFFRQLHSLSFVCVCDWLKFDRTALLCDEMMLLMLAMQE